MSENVASEIIRQVNELTSFIDYTLDRMQLIEKKKRKIRFSKEKNLIKQAENERRNHLETLKQKRIDNVDWSDHIDIKQNDDDKNKDNKLYLLWNNYFVCNNSDELELSSYINNNNQHDCKLSSYTNMEFCQYLSSRLDRSLKSIYLRRVFSSTPSLIIKTMQMFHRRRFQTNDQKNFQILLKTDNIWWSAQFNLNCINYIEWIEKCSQYEISPLVLIKEFVKSKRLFLCYQTSVELTKKERKETESLTSQTKNKIPKIQLKFYHQICQIPANHKNWFKNDILKEKQHQIYYKWISFAIYIHITKWLEFQINKLQNPKTSIPLKEYEYECDESDGSDGYGIPNINNILSLEMCTAICNLCIWEGVIRDNIRVYKDLTVRDSSKLFERICVSKIKDVVSRYKGNKIQVLNEKKIRKLNNGKKYIGIEYYYLVSPDLLLSECINVNGIDVIWMDMKFYYLSPNDALGVELVKKSVLKYVKAFGNGAIIGCGLHKNFQQCVNQLLIDKNCQMYSVLVLDASKWSKCIIDYQKYLTY